MTTDHNDLTVEPINGQPISLEDLAVMIARGFHATATKADLTDLRHDFTDLRGELSTFRLDVDERFRETRMRFQDLEHSVSEIRDIVRPTAHSLDVALEDIERLKQHARFTTATE